MNLINFAITDPHIHQWNPYTTPHSAALLVKLLGKYPQLMDKTVRLVKPKALLETLGLTENALNPYMPADYARDCASECARDGSTYTVDTVVHVEADWHEHRGAGVVNETRWVSQLDFAAQGMHLGGIVGTADVRASYFPKVLKKHQAASPKFRGIRRMASWHPDAGIHRWCKQPHLYSDKRFLRGFEFFAGTGLSFDAWCYSVQLPEVTALAKRFSTTPIVIDHLATPAGLFGAVGRYTGKTVAARQAIFQQWQDDIALLAQHQNVHAKLSGLMMPVLGHRFHEQGRRASVEQMINLLSPMVEHAVQVFGIERLIYASNFPMDKASASMPDIITAFAQMIAPHGETALKKVFRDNALGFYRIS